MSSTEPPVALAPAELLAGRSAAPDGLPARRRGWLIRRMLLVADLVGLALAFLVAELARGAESVPGSVSAQLEYLLFCLTLPAWVVAAKLYGLYDRDEERADHSTADELTDVFHLVTVGTWLFFVGAWVTGIAEPDLAKLLVFWTSSIALVSGGRAAARTYARRRVAYLQNTVVVGAGDVGQLVARKLLRHPEYGLNLVGFVDAAPLELSPDLRHVAVLGAPEELPDLVRLLDVERVIVAFTGERDEEVLELVRALDGQVQVAIVPRLFELIGPNIGIHTVEGLPMVGLPPLHLPRSSRLLKRALDLLLSGLALLVLAPLLAVVAVAIKRSSPGPVFFRQLRVGEGGEPFLIYKFRTMFKDADERKAEICALNLHAQEGGDPRMFKVVDDPRVTRVGRVLRRWSLDELPQLLNVVRGEMSLVGPRPLIFDEARYVGDWARRRLELKPGITGLWQVLGRSEIAFDQMIRLDYLYVTTWSLAGDLRLLVRTLPIVCRGTGSY